MDKITLASLIFLFIAVIFLYLDQFNVVDIPSKCSGFNNPQPYRKDELIAKLNEYRTKYQTDYGDKEYNSLLNRPSREADIYFDAIIDRYTRLQKIGNLPPKDKLLPPLNDLEMDEYINRTRNWAGYKYSNIAKNKELRCGPNFNNTACPNNKCCSTYGYCGSGGLYCAKVGTPEASWAGSMNDGIFNDKRPSFFNTMSAQPMPAQPVPLVKQILNSISAVGKTISGFNNPDGYNRDEIIRSLEKGKNVYKTDYNEAVITALLNKPRPIVTEYFQRVVNMYQMNKNSNILSSGDLFPPPLNDKQEMSEYFKLKGRSAPTPAPTSIRGKKSFRSWG